MMKIQCIALLFFFSIHTHAQMIDKSTVKDLNIEKYLGQWYEIARYDHSFERGLQGVTAHYSWSTNGKRIKVVNKGYKIVNNEKQYSQAVGKAKIPNTSDASKLKVAFFLFFYADYFVLELAADYSWAIVGSKSDNYLWILSRTPAIETQLYQELILKITKRGYSASKLIVVNQE